MRHSGYLSYSSKRYRVIVAGSPICNDKRTIGEAVAAANYCSVKLEPKMWNGDLGAFVDFPQREVTG